MPYPSPFPSFRTLNNIQLTVQTTNLVTNQNLPLVLPVFPLTETACKYHVHYRQHTATTEVCRSIVSLICEGIDWLNNSRYMGRYTEG